MHFLGGLFGSRLLHLREERPAQVLVRYDFVRQWPLNAKSRIVVAEPLPQPGSIEFAHLVFDLRVVHQRLESVSKRLGDEQRLTGLRSEFDCEMLAISPGFPS